VGPEQLPSSMTVNAKTSSLIPLPTGSRVPTLMRLAGILQQT
jgi:hypothetical protein